MHFPPGAATAFVAGFCLLSGKPVWLLLVAIIVAMQVIRARKQSKVLEDKFGEAYRAYRRKTWFQPALRVPKASDVLEKIARARATLDNLLAADD